jgi:hypothetical protein
VQERFAAADCFARAGSLAECCNRCEVFSGVLPVACTDWVSVYAQQIEC